MSNSFTNVSTLKNVKNDNVKMTENLYAKFYGCRYVPFMFSPSEPAMRNIENKQVKMAGSRSLDMVIRRSAI
jgi:hypothetical protein